MLISAINVVLYITIARPKLNSTIFDIRVLSEIAGINAEYFNEACKDWRSLRNPSLEKETLFNFILPQLVNH